LEGVGASPDVTAGEEKKAVFVFKKLPGEKGGRGSVREISKKKGRRGRIGTGWVRQEDNKKKGKQIRPRVALAIGLLFRTK